MLAVWGDKRRVRPAKYRSPAVMVITAGYPFGATLWQLHCRTTDPVSWLEARVFAGGLATPAMLIHRFASFSSQNPYNFSSRETPGDSLPGLTLF